MGTPEVIIIEAKRTDYSVEKATKRTITVGEFKYYLEDFEDDTPIILSHDNGYTYGTIRESDIDSRDMSVLESKVPRKKLRRSTNESTKRVVKLNRLHK